MPSIYIDILPKQVYNKRINSTSLWTNGQIEKYKHILRFKDNHPKETRGKWENSIDMKESLFRTCHTHGVNTYYYCDLKHSYLREPVDDVIKSKSLPPLNKITFLNETLDMVGESLYLLRRKIDILIDSKTNLFAEELLSTCERAVELFEEQANAQLRHSDVNIVCHAESDHLSSFILLAYIYKTIMNEKKEKLIIKKISKYFYSEDIDNLINYTLSCLVNIDEIYKGVAVDEFNKLTYY